jgi:hypothetical protein
VRSRITTFLVLAAAAVALTVVSTGPASGGRTTDLSTRKFQTPSRNISCRVDGILRCDIRSGLKPEPKKDCELDWTGLIMRKEGRAKPNCAGDTVADQNAPVLEYGQHWERSGRRCVSRESGLYCTNAGGWHFKLSRDSWDRWYTP